MKPMLGRPLPHALCGLALWLAGAAAAQALPEARPSPGGVALFDLGPAAEPPQVHS